MERHTVLGHELLPGSGNDLLELAATIAWTHHERWDGAGYPRRLAGEEIPLAGRIVAVADVFDALTSDRPYRPKLSEERARAEIEALRGAAFDPRVVDAYLGADVLVAGRDERTDVRARGRPSADPRVPLALPERQRNHDRRQHP